MQTEADRISAAVQRIREAAMRLPAGKRAGYVAENIRHHQDRAQRYAIARKQPAGWSIALHEEMLHGLVELEAEFRAAGRIAA